MEKLSVYDIITNRIIEALEAGTVPWQKPWTVTWPKNFNSKREYSGINVLLLSLQNRSTPYWATFKGIQEKGGHIKAGEKGTQIVFTSKVEKEVEDETTGEKKGKDFFMLRYYYVWNLDQVEGIEIPKDDKLEFTPIERAEQIATGYRARVEGERADAFIRHGGDRACYSSHFDYILLPFKEQFKSIPEYYSTLFHEMTHSTGHKKRLARFEADDKDDMFGSESYSKEELVAELGASFLRGEAGISDNQTDKNSEAYIAGWLSRLKGDKKLIISASAQAQKSTEFILGK
jgi:antirestriction protein ArdC